MKIQAQAATLFVLLAVLLAPGAPAQVAHESSVPADAHLLVSIPDTLKFWEDARQLPIVKGIEQFLATPGMQGNLQYQQFNLEMRKLADELGFPVTPDEILMNVVSDLTLFVAPDAAVGETGALILGVRDTAKATRILEALDAKNKEMSEGADATEQFGKVEVDGIEVSHFLSTGDGGTNEGFYALVQDRIVFASTLDSFRSAANGVEGTKLTETGEYQISMGELPQGNADLTLWVSDEALAQAALPGMPQIPGLGNGMQLGMIADVVADGIDFRSISTGALAMIPAGLEPRELKTLALAPSNPMMAGASGAFDMNFTLDLIEPLMEQMGAMMGGNPLAQFEAALGISLRGDVAPALGNELMFGLNDVRPSMQNMLIPNVDVLLAAEVRDPAAATALMQKIEATITRAMGGGMQAGAMPSDSLFTTENLGGVEARVMTSPVPGIAPSYAMHQGLLIIGVNREALAASLQRLAGGGGLTGSPLFTQLAQRNGSRQIMEYSVVDVRRIVDSIVRPYMGMAMTQVPNVDPILAGQFVDMVAANLGRIASLGTVQGNLSFSHGKWQMP